MYSRELDGKTYTFGVSGKLWRDALVMYDHQTRTLWSHITGEAIEGALKGKRLTVLSSMPRIAWKEWKQHYPETKVLSVSYGPRHQEQRMEERRRDNYAHYHASPETGISGTEYTDARLENKALVVGVRINDNTYHAYPFAHFEGKPVLNDQVDELPVLAFRDANSQATSVFLRTVDGQPLTFEATSGYYAKDTQTGTRWNLITGEAVEGELKGKHLERLPSVNVYWFAWARYYPETTVHE